MGHDDYVHDHFERVTEVLARTAARYLDRIKRAEIGVELGVPLGTVGSWLSRGRAAIAEQLERPRPNQTGGGNHE